MRAVTATLVLVLASFVLAAGASAQQGDAGAVDPEEQMRAAREAFEAGTRAYEAGLFEEALASFQRSYALTASPDLLYNIATVADRLRRDQEALEAYETYLRLRPEAEDREHIEGRIAVLRTSVARSLEEDRARREAEERAQRGADGQPAQGGNDGAGLSDGGERGAVRPADGAGILPWIVVGTGAVLVAGGMVFLLVAQSDIASVESPEGDEPRWSEVEGAHDRAPTLSAVGIVALGVGVAAVGAGLAWAVLGSGSSDAAADEGVEVAVGPSGIVVAGSF